MRPFSKRPPRKIRMANLAIGSHSTNGVAATIPIAAHHHCPICSRGVSIKPRRRVAGSASQRTRRRPLARTTLLAICSGQVEFADWFGSSMVSVSHPNAADSGSVSMSTSGSCQCAAHRRPITASIPALAPPRTFFSSPGGHGRQADYQVHQQPRRSDRRRSGGARPPQGSVPPRIQRVACRTSDPCHRRFKSDLDGGIRSKRHQQYEIHDEWSAHHRNPRWSHHRNGRRGGRRELLPSSASPRKRKVAEQPPVGITRNGTMTTNRDPYRALI